jgi:hypothetical protein
MILVHTYLCIVLVTQTQLGTMFHETIIDDHRAKQNFL